MNRAAVRAVEKSYIPLQILKQRLLRSSKTNDRDGFSYVYFLVCSVWWSRGHDRRSTRGAVFQDLRSKSPERRPGGRELFGKTWLNHEEFSTRIPTKVARGA